MAIDLDKIKQNLRTSRRVTIARTINGNLKVKQQVRIVPYKHQTDNPFIEFFSLWN